MQIQKFTDKQKALIENAQNVALFAHQNPDGDAYGSSLGLQKILQNMGKQADVFLPDVSDVYSFLPWYENIKTAFDYAEYDLLIILDCSTFDRLGKNYFDNPECFSKTYYDKTLVFDHHISGHNTFEINPEHIVQCHWYASTCELIYDVFSPEFMQYFDAESATCLLLGVYTDTGGFKYGESAENSFSVAWHLVKLWADRNLIVNEYMQGRKLEEVQFAAWLIDNVKVYARDGLKIMYTHYCAEDLKKFAIDTERATLGLNILQTVKWDGITMVVRYIDEKLKFSMRSRWDLNVGAIADSMWGGGHKNAAGFSVKIWNVEKYEEKIEEVLEKITMLG